MLQIASDVNDLIPETLPAPSDIDFGLILHLALYVGAGVLGGWIAYFLIWKILGTVARRRESIGLSKIVRNAAKPALMVAIGMGVSLAYAIAKRAEAVPEYVVGWGWPFLRVYMILALTWLTIGIVSGVDDAILAKYRMDVRDNLKARRVHTQVSIISRTVMILIGIIGFALALMTFEGIEQLGASLLASAGIVGIVVGFAARPVLSNLIAGIQIALTQPIRLDDAVIINDEWGRIEEITPTFVVVKIWDKRRLIVPFSKIIEEPFQNWTRRSADIIGVVKLYLDYTAPIDAIREELDRLVRDNPKWDGETQVVQVTDATERTILVRVLVSAGDSGDAWDLRCDVREGLIAFLRREHPYCLPREREEKFESESDQPPASAS